MLLWLVLFVLVVCCRLMMFWLWSFGFVRLKVLVVIGVVMFMISVRVICRLVVVLVGVLS